MLQSESDYLYCPPIIIKGMGEGRYVLLIKPEREPFLHARLVLISLSFLRFPCVSLRS